MLIATTLEFELLVGNFGRNFLAGLLLKEATAFVGDLVGCVGAQMETELSSTEGKRCTGVSFSCRVLNEHQKKFAHLYPLGLLSSQTGYNELCDHLAMLWWKNRRRIRCGLCRLGTW